MSFAAQLERAIKAAGVAIDGVSIGQPFNKATWKVQPTSLQAAAQPVIDAFNPADPAVAAADLAALAQATSRKKDILAMLATVVRGRDVAAWNAATANQKVNAVLAEADVFKNIREFIDDKISS